MLLAQANIAIPGEIVEQMFGSDRDPQVVADERRWFELEMRATTRWQADLAALQTMSPRVLVGIGEDSVGQLCDRTSTALATALGIEPTMFPGGHTGFADDPDAFNTRLRTVLREPNDQGTNPAVVQLTRSTEPRPHDTGPT